jgi:undecaprenyl diphosphate synthase
MALVEQVLKLEIDELNREGVRVMTIGRREGLPSSVIDSIERAEKITRSNTAMTLVIALNYGGRAEIVDTIKNIATKVSARQLLIDDINEALISDSLYTAAIPDPDLLIRTGGDLRISNFLLWQLAYTEIWVTQSYWPDFSREEYIEAIMEYQCRERRYGGIEQKGTGRSH